MIRRTGDDYGEALGALLPTGPAWPRDADSPLMRLVSGLAQVWGRVDGRAADLAEVETDPRFTYELLGEWERAFGLPDPYTRFTLTSAVKSFSFGPSSFGGARGRIQPPPDGYFWKVSGQGSTPALTLDERRRALVNKVTLQGGQSRAFFEGVGANLGYAIQITEFSPFQFGLSSFGGRRGRMAAPSVRFFWNVKVYGGRTTRFRFGASSFGRDPILSLRRAEDLESCSGAGSRLRPR